MTNNSWLETKDIDVYYNNKHILKKITLKLDIGENTVIIGKNGSGKTTLIKTILKHKYPLVKDDSFIKIFNKRNINLWELRSKIGYVFSEIDLRIKANTLTKDVILSGYQGTYGLINNKNISSQQYQSYLMVLNKMDLERIGKYYCELSDGQRRRVLIARALINNPKVLILDEPTCMLDIKSKFELLAILNELSKGEITLLYITNNIDNIIQGTSRIVFIKNGSIIADGHPNDIINSKNISNLYEYKVNIRNLDGHWRAFPIK